MSIPEGLIHFSGFNEIRTIIFRVNDQFQTNGPTSDAQSYDVWLQAKIDAALARSGELQDHDSVMEAADVILATALKPYASGQVDR
jgi:hypothetical protein